MEHQVEHQQEASQLKPRLRLTVNTLMITVLKRVEMQMPTRWPP